MRLDRAVRWIRAPAGILYGALTTRHAVQAWLPPTGARGVIHEFEPWPGGRFRMTLIFDASEAAGSGKSSRNTDVVEGEFLELVPDRCVRQRFTFVSDNPSFAGAMIMTWRLAPGRGGTQVEITAANVPPGIDPSAHQRGMESSLANLATFVESRGRL